MKESGKRMHDTWSYFASSAHSVPCRHLHLEPALISHAGGGEYSRGNGVMLFFVVILSFFTLGLLSFGVARDSRI